MGVRDTDSGSGLPGLAGRAAGRGDTAISRGSEGAEVRRGTRAGTAGAEERAGTPRGGEGLAVAAAEEPAAPGVRVGADASRVPAPAVTSGLGASVAREAAAPRRSPLRRMTQREVRLVLLALLPYAAFGALWLTLADPLVERLTSHPDQLAAWEANKGWIFVVLSLFLVYLLVRGQQVARVRSDRKFAAAFAANPDPMAILRFSDGVVVEVNDGFIEQLGYAKSELVGRLCLETGVWADLRSATKFWEALREKRELRSFEMEFRAKDGTPRAVLLSARVTRIGRQEYVVAVAKDVTEHRAFRARLEHQALHDPLTDLPNRALLLDRLALELARAARRRKRVAVLSVDVDRFKVVNESLGHGTGDRLLIEIGRRLTLCLRREDTVGRRGGTVARMGADEYTIVLGEISAVEDALTVVERIRRTLAAPFLLAGEEVSITVGIGVAVSAEGAGRAEDLLRHAGIAMHRAKEKGLDKMHVFDPGVDAREVRRLRLENELRGAVDRGELELRFQPVVSLESGMISGFESLVRWRHRELGLLSPLDFIPVAEESGLISRIGRWVVEEACRQGKLWADIWSRYYPERPPLRMAVNLSVRELQEPELAELVDEALQRTGLDPRCLELEITEGFLVRSHPALHRLKRLDVRLLVDDFGTGYSSLAYLSRLPVDAVKIDRSFIAEFARNPEAAAIVRAVIAMAGTLKLDVVAEGVEREEQLAGLRELGCGYAQGYLFARPLRALDAEALLREGGGW